MHKLAFVAVAALIWDARAVEVELTSPRKESGYRFVVSDGATLSWRLDGTRPVAPIVEPSRLGLVFAGAKPFGAMALETETRRSVDEVWTNRFGANAFVTNRFNEATWIFRETEALGRRLGVVARAYANGVAFRYLVPEQESVRAFVVGDELTEFRFQGDPLAWMTVYDGHQNSHEGAYCRRSLRSVGKKEVIGFPVIVELGGERRGSAGRPKNAAVFEAALTGWAGMFLTVSEVQKPSTSTALKAELSPSPNSTQGGGATGGVVPALSPWRVVALGDFETAGGELYEVRNLMLNLNPPPEGGDAAFDWVQPGASGWDWWVNSNNDLSKERILEAIDFAAEMGWRYHTIDAGWAGRPASIPGVVLEPTPSLDLPGCLRHAKEKGVGLILWTHWAVLEQCGVEETFAKFERWGVAGVKIDFTCRQDREMVDWYERTVRCAAKHRLLINFHAAIKPTGMERTWPNQITREAIRGNELTKWEVPSDALNTAILPYTRFLIGPGDYTPGGVDNVFAKDFVCQMDRGHRYADMSEESRRMKIYAQEVGTRMHALALCVAFDSPLMTLCDYPERYRGAAGVEVLRKLPTVWKRTVPTSGGVAASIGDGYAVWREAFDGRVYYAAEFCTAQEYAVVPADFLPPGKWVAEIWSDDPARTPNDANAVLYRKLTIDTGSRPAVTIGLDLCAEGGVVMRFQPLEFNLFFE